jgi:hypothetical protein
MSARLEGLDAVDWPSLRDHGGSAEGVARCIRDLVSADAAVREDSLRELYGRLLHQSSVCAATAVAVPFVVALAADASTPDRDRLFLFLRAVLVLLPDNSREGFTPSPEQAQVKRVDEEALRASVEAIDADALITGLDDADARVRAAVAATLGLCPGEGRVALRLREAIQRESDPVARSSVRIALAVQHRRLGLHGEQDAFEEAFSAATPRSLERVAAGVALVHVRAEAVGDAVIEELGRAGETGPDRTELPWNGGDLVGLVAMALGDIARTRPQRAVPFLRAIVVERAREARRAAAPRAPTAAEIMMAKVMGQPPPEPGPPEIDPAASLRLLRLASELLRAAFARFAGRRGAPVTVGELDDAQRAMLHELADLEVEAPYLRYGLPAPPDISRWLQGA